MHKRVGVLLVGAGKFGVHHLRILQKLEKLGDVQLLGVVVKTRASQKHIREQFKIPAYIKLTTQLLKSADAVDIVTPAHTHAALIKRCLRDCNVLVEKPLTLQGAQADRLVKQAKKNGKRLMVGHIFRFHPIALELKKIFGGKKLPRMIQGEFTSPADLYRKGEIAPFEYLHFFDLIDFLFERSPSVVWNNQVGSISVVSLRYPGLCDAELRLGWEGDRKRRWVEFYFGDDATSEKLRCDFLNNTLTWTRGEDITVKTLTSPVEPLEQELRTFIAAVNHTKPTVIDGQIGARLVKTAERSSHSSIKPRVAVIGGGIFGATCALILGEHSNVTLFERNDSLMSESSWGNQYRHHMGYHYPRSRETILSVQKSSADFKNFYPETLIHYPSFYGIAKQGSKTTPKEFLSLCRTMDLPYKIKYPKESLLNRSLVSTCIQTPEATYDYEKLKSLVHQRMEQNSNIDLQLNTKITRVALTKDGKKRLTYKSNGLPKHQKSSFDYVINATYVNYNQFCRWMNFSEKLLRYQLKELIVLDLGIKEKTAITIMDGPFSSLIPMGRTGLFTLGNVLLSIHKNLSRFDESVARRWTKTRTSHWPQMQDQIQKWIPILKHATYVRSMYTQFAVESASDKNDDRKTDVTSHGFGCYSILAGKIITCATTGYAIRNSIEKTR